MMRNMRGLKASVFCAVTALTTFAEDLRPPTNAAVVQDERGYNAWPMIQAMGTNLVCVYSRDHAFPRDGHMIWPGTRDSYAKISYDGGLTWSEESVLAADEQVGEVNEGIGLDSQGALLAWVRCWGEESRQRHELYRSLDGRSFTKIATLRSEPMPMQILDPVFVPGLGLVSPWFSGRYDAVGGHAWGILVSADDGRSWQMRTIERNLSVEEWVTESSLVSLGGGRILLIGRCERVPGSQFQVTSSDGGKTWTKRRTNIADVHASTPCLVYDDQTGLVANYYYERGARKLKRRIARADSIFAHPEAWPEPEVLSVGFEPRAWDAGNVNVTRLQGKLDCCAWYTGTMSNAMVVVTRVPVPKALPDDRLLRVAVTTESDALKVSVGGKGAALTVTDKRTGRTWAPQTEGRLFVTNVTQSGRAVCATLVEPKTRRTWGLVVSLSPKRPELLVTVTGEGSMPENLDYPYAFATRPGDRLIVPLNEGISFPVEAADGLPSRLSAYRGNDLSMSFWGVQDDATGAGYMGIIETADDAAAVFARPASGYPFAAGVSWEPQKGRFGYSRRLRYIFFDKGGYVAMCKRYRVYAREQGKLKTFAETAKDRPLVDRLLGAANIWYWGSDSAGFWGGNQDGMARQVKAAGIDRFLWSAGGKPVQVTALAQMEGVLVGRYDVYRDIYPPELVRQIGWGWNSDAWPEGAAWNSADSNDLRKAWGVKMKDGSWRYSTCMCDAVSAKFCRAHVSADLKEHPYTARFIDVTTAAGWDVCGNPAHPMTHSDSRAYRMDLLRLLGDDFGLVVGSETGHDAAVPYCDYFEGMLSLCHYRVPDSGRKVEKVWTDVPPQVAKFQMGAAYRLPLWELVYHDCVCAHWYWGDYNNKLPTLWDKRDLFNVLYGTMGMYMFNDAQWAQDKERFVRSYRMTSPVARKTGYNEMLDHRILSADRLVQRTTFADGTVVTVNFGETPFKLPEGGELVGGGYLVK